MRSIRSLQGHCPCRNQPPDHSALHWVAMRGHVRHYDLKKGGRLWAAVLYEGKRVARNGKLRDSYRWIRGFRTQKAAQTELNKVLETINNGTYVEQSKQT